MPMNLSNPFQSKIHFPTKEEEILTFWSEHKIFEQSLAARKNSGRVFYFYDGPPFATGLPHYGHILAGTIKDVIPRFRTMKGDYVERKFGWDCHGLPVEFEAEKELKLNGKADIQNFGVAKFNEYCRSIVLRYSNEWRRNVRRMARWVDLENDYKTMDTSFMESIWFVFHQLWEKKLIYSSFKIVPFSPRLSTPLSNFEVNLGYKMVKDPSIVVKFPVLKEENCFFLAWTTTPWTLTANLCLTVHPKITYAMVEKDGARYILAKDAISRYFEGETTILQEWKGKEMEKKGYEPIFSYASKDLNLNFSPSHRPAFFIALADYVELSTGTGIVHTAPMFGEEDYKTGEKYALPHFLPFNDSGEFTNQVPDFQGKFFKDADPLIIQYLKERNLLFHKTTIEHSYPFCWRSGAPLMYRGIPSWFLDVEAMKPKLLENNNSIGWVPEHIKHGRMGKWLENARDWAISRNRYWGNPIPIWNCQKCQHQSCLSSLAELNLAIKNSPFVAEKVVLTDLHSHIIDVYPLECPKCKSMMWRTKEVLDCWFESGAMPYGQMHYPFENKEKFEQSFPADFISEGLDQTRGWFYTLAVLSTALFEKPAFKNCIVSGLILAEDGQKMSKSLKNYPDPDKMIQTYGADAIRLYMLSSGAMKAEELRFSEQGLVEIIRDLILPLWNVLNFFHAYSGVEVLGTEKFTTALKKMEEDFCSDSNSGLVAKNIHPLDLWILSRLENLKAKVQQALENYQLLEAVLPFKQFVFELSNWYLRISRKRFVQEKNNQKNKEISYASLSLYKVLKETSLLFAPFAPYFSEMLFEVLRAPSEKISVHLMDYPEVKKEWTHPSLEKEVESAEQLVSMGRSLRAERKIKLRQPLKAAYVFSAGSFKKTPAWLNQIVLAELNVKELIFSEEEKDFFAWKLLPNLPVLGKKYGPLLPKIKEKLNLLQFDFSEIRQLEKGEKFWELDFDGQKIRLGKEELLIHFQELPGKVAISQGSVTLALNTELTLELLEEGLVREFINRLQNERKRLNLKVEEKVDLKIATTQEFGQILSKNQGQIQAESLTKEIIWQKDPDSDWIDAEIEGQNCWFLIEKAGL